MEKFIKDLENGELYEDFVVKLMNKYGFTYKNHSDSKDMIERKKYDFIMVDCKGNEYKFEIKSDIFSFETENEIFEFSFNNKKSGILSTEADFWVTCHLLSNRVTIYRVRELREFCLECIKGSEKEYFIKNAGDNYSARVILVKHENMLKYVKNRKDIYIEIPIYNSIEILKYFEKRKPKYKKIIKKLKEISKIND